MATPPEFAAAPAHLEDKEISFSSHPYSNYSRSEASDHEMDRLKALRFTDDKPHLTVIESTTTDGSDWKGEAGVTYGGNGQTTLLPAPTQDPKDPLNLSRRHKIIGLVCLCFFGALAAAAELILGAMLPVFAMEYAGLDPKLLVALSESGGLPAGADPLEYLSMLPNAPPIWKTYLLASMPILVMGVANLFLIPLAISVGRRFVVLASGLFAIGGAIWAGCSTSLESHIAARCVQALGAGTVESLIPFMIQDLVFFHQRNTAISGVFAAQGAIIIGLGIAAPNLIVAYSWRWVYYITAAGAGFFLIGVFFFMPETRWERTKEELQGIPRQETTTHFTPRTLSYNLALTNGPIQWGKGGTAFLDTLRTFFYPHIFYITILNSVMIATAFAAAYTVSPALLTAPYSWSFVNLGYCLVPVLIAAFFVAGVTGKGADWIANSAAKKSGGRVPENQILNLILPTICGLVGSIIFGLAGQNEAEYHWSIFLTGLGLMAFGFLGANTVGAVYVLESYPQLAGPALVNIASFRCIFAFILSFRVSQWVADYGYFHSMLIYTGCITLVLLLMPVVYKFGPAWRRRFPGPDR